MSVFLWALSNSHPFSSFSDQRQEMSIGAPHFQSFQAERKVTEHNRAGKTSSSSHTCWKITSLSLPRGWRNGHTINGKFIVGFCLLGPYLSVWVSVFI